LIVKFEVGGGKKANQKLAFARKGRRGTGLIRRGGGI